MKKLIIMLFSVLCFTATSYAAERFFDPSTTLRVNGERPSTPLRTALSERSESNGRSRTIEIKAKRFVYTPSIIKVNKGDLVRIRLISEDVTHGLFLDGYGLNTSTHPGQEGFLQFIADKPGRFTFRCSVTCGEFHPYMVGYFVVEQNLRLYLFVFLTLAIGIGGLLVFLKQKPQQPHEDKAQEQNPNTPNE